VSKVTNSKLPDFEFKDKASVASSEILAFLKAAVNECCMLTFGPEKSMLSKLVSKLHRYLAANLSTYAQRCVLVVSEIEQLTDAAETEKKALLPTGQLICNWFDFEG
jgi:hypothetical protein